MNSSFSALSLVSLFLLSSRTLDAALNRLLLSVLVHGAAKYLGMKTTLWVQFIVFKQLKRKSRKWPWLVLQYVRELSLLGMRTADGCWAVSLLCLDSGLFSWRISLNMSESEDAGTTSVVWILLAFAPSPTYLCVTSLSLSGFHKSISAWTNSLTLCFFSTSV